MVKKNYMPKLEDFMAKLMSFLLNVLKICDLDDSFWNIQNTCVNIQIMALVRHLHKNCVLCVYFLHFGSNDFFLFVCFSFNVTEKHCGYHLQKKKICTIGDEMVSENT